MPSTFTIEPQGPFSWASATDMGGNFGPIARHWRAPVDGPNAPLRIAFPLDGDFTPVAAALRFEEERLQGEVAGTDQVEAVRRQVARMFSLDHDGSGYPAVAERDPAVRPLMDALHGLRPVCFSSPYECAAWAVMSQRISMRQAARAQDALIAEHGHRLDVAGGEVWSFPTPERLLTVREVPGLAPVKVERLHGVARAGLAGILDADRLRLLGDVDGPASVRSIPGIGPFWSSGIYLRGCGIVDVFPEEPLAIAVLGQMHGLGDRPDPADVARLSEAYRPYRMWVCVLLRVAANRGLLPGIRGREMEIRHQAPRRAVA